MYTNSYYLIADIGGTNSNFALINLDEKEKKIIFKKKILTKEIINIIETINKISSKIIEEQKILIENLCIGAAGISINEKIKLTNSNLEINKKEILEKTSIKNIRIINDFTALAYSIETLNKDKIKILNNKNTGDKKLIIGAGTGLGTSFKLNKNCILESEAGHIEIPCECDEEYKLVKYLQKKLKKTIIEYEDILSGNGIEEIYKFLIFEKKEYKKYIKNLSAKDISKNKKTNLAAKRTFKIFYSYYAKFAKEMSLIFLPDEIYLAGGIVEKNLIFSKQEFLEKFTGNENFKEYLENISIKIIKDYDSSLEGLINYIKINN